MSSRVSRASVWRWHSATSTHASTSHAADDAMRAADAAAIASSLDDGDPDLDALRSASSDLQRAVAKQYRLKFGARSFALYFAFVVVFTIAVLGTREGAYDFYMSQMLRGLLLETEFDVADAQMGKTFAQISSLTDVWLFLQGPLLAGLFSDISSSGAPLAPDELGFVSKHNRLVGRVLLLQARVQADSGCKVDPAFAAPAVRIPHCYAAWGSGRDQATSPIGDAAQYTWHDQVRSGTTGFSGLLGSYDGSGYEVELPPSYASSRALMQDLRAAEFLSHETRAVWVVFTLFNGNINRFTTARLIFERDASGAVVPSVQTRTLDLLFYDRPDFMWTLLPELGVAMLAVALVLSELSDWWMLGRAYLRDIWNYYDALQLGSVLWAAVCRLQVWIAMREVKRMGAEAEGYTKALMEAVGWADTTQACLALAALLTYLKVINFLAAMPRAGLVAHTLYAARGNLCLFSIWTGIWLVGFACAFTLALGSQLAPWSTFGDSLLSLFQLAQGRGRLLAMVRANAFISSLLLLAFLVLILFVLPNALTSIILLGYREANARDPKLNFGIVLQSAVRRQWSRLWAQHYLDCFRSREAIEAREAATAQRRAVQLAEVADARARRQKEEDTVQVEEYLDRSRHTQLNGYAHVFTHLTQQLKALVFAQQAESEATRGAISAAASEMARLREVNRDLRRAASSAGYVWLPQTQQLVRSTDEQASVAEPLAGGGLHRRSPHRHRHGDKGRAPGGDSFSPDDGSHPAPTASETVGGSASFASLLGGGSGVAVAPSGTARTAPELDVRELMARHGVRDLDPIASPRLVERHGCGAAGSSPGCAPAMKLVEERLSRRASGKPITR